MTATPRSPPPTLSLPFRSPAPIHTPSSTGSCPSGFIIGLSLTSAFIAAVFQPFIPVAGEPCSQQHPLPTLQKAIAVCCLLLTAPTATIIATITKTEPLTLIRLLGMAVAVAGAPARPHPVAYSHDSCMQARPSLQSHRATGVPPQEISWHSAYACL
jgi:hypothetical protein